MSIGDYLLVPQLLPCQAGRSRLNRLPLQRGIAGACGQQLHDKSTVAIRTLNCMCIALIRNSEQICLSMRILFCYGQTS